MDIIKESIIDLTGKFKHLEDSLTGCNYVVTFDFKKFQFTKNYNFSLDNLKELFSEENIQGNIVLSDYEKVLKEIREAMSFFSYEGGLVDITNDIPLINSRETIFWQLIAPNCKLPPKIVYKHEAEYESYFGNYVMWGFCYILLNDEEGIVIAGQAWD